MKQGKSIVELAKEIERQAAARKDALVDTRAMRLTNEGTLTLGDGEPIEVTDTAHNQIGGRVGIPAKYYDRMLHEAPELLARNVNHWFQSNPEQRLVRMLDGRVRAFLSNRYQRIDNNHVAEAVLPVLEKVPGIRFASAEITDSRLYIKAITESMQETVPGSRRVGDVVQAGVMIANSEIGMGALHVKPFLEFLICTNGMVRDDIKRRFNHVGRVAEIVDMEAVELSDATRRLEDMTVLSKVRDVVNAALDYNKFRETIARLGDTTQQKIEGDPVKAIEMLGDSFAMTEGERGSVLRHFIEGGDLSRYGVIQAVTRTAEDLPSYDRATQFEAFGGGLLQMTKREWEQIATAK